MRRLYVKIYLTLLACLALVALATIIVFFAGEDEEDRGWSSRRAAVIAAMLPADAEPADQQLVLDRLASAFSADLALYDREGNAIATAGDALPRNFLEDSEADDPEESWGRHGPPGRFVVGLPDGRTLAVRSDMRFMPSGGSPLAFILAIAAAIGVAAYPVVRHLTRRLETLRRGVETWGGGALDARVQVTGRDEVAAVAASFNVAAERIERLVASHRSLLANASHELRSPLARLRMAIDLYERSPHEATRTEILQNLGELDDLVGEILLASRLDHIDGLERTEPVDLLALAAEEGARSGVAVSGTPATVTGDPRLLTRLVRNLMQNGLRHGAPPVTAEIARLSNAVELRVIDHGAGIPKTEAERVFEPFYRPSGRSEAAGGWGLGLALVRQIAARHGASVRYEQAPEGGACFVVSFPVAGNGKLSGRVSA